MSWRVEKTKSGQDLVWENPELGIAPSALKGTANLQNLNIATEPGQAYVSYARTNQAQAAITGGILTPDGATLFDAPATLKGGQWIKVTASTVTGITATTNPTTASVDYLVVGGGGGGGGGVGTAPDDRGGTGGGGAGEVKEGTTVLAVGVYSITVGAGGAGSSTGTGNTGSDSVISSVYTAKGGAGGGGFGGNGANAVTGGSGGGAGAIGTGTGAGSAGTGGTGATGGNDGGDAFFRSDGALSSAWGGGGGGAGAVGANAIDGDAGSGGIGVQSSISGSATYYGGGGGGGAESGGALGGQGGGANGSGSDSTPGNAGTANTGGGGGGVGITNSSVTVTGGAGGSGVVVISYTTGTLLAIGGTVTNTDTNTIHTFTSSGSFEIKAIYTDGVYFVSYENTSDEIKLSTTFDPYGTSPITTHGTTGTVTFDTLTTINRPLAKAVEKYYTATGTEYRYYILDANSYVWVYDTQVYDSTLASNGVGITWMLPDFRDYTNVDFTGMGILNGWLTLISVEAIYSKPTVLLGDIVTIINDGYLINPFPNHRNFVLTGAQGTLVYTDGNFLGEIYPTTSLITSVANVQSYAQYTASTTTGTVTVLIGGSIPTVSGSTRLPVVFFTGGTLPTAITNGTVYYIEYNLETGTFEAYTAATGGSALNIATGASGNQYFNTYYPVGGNAGANSATPTLQFTQQRVNLPFYEQAKCLLEVGNTVLIGCQGSKVYPWNQVDSTPSDVITLPESDVQAMVNTNNTAYIFAGNKGNIYITNNVVASLALKVPDYCAGVPGSPLTYIEPYFTWGDATFVRGRVYFSILDQTATKAGNCGGVWSFIPSQNVDPGQDVGIALRLENQNSYGDYDGYAPILIAAEEQSATSPQYWAAWQDSYNNATAAFGIDFTATTPVTTAVFETDLVPTGTLLDKTTFSQLEYKLGVPLNSGDSLQLYWRTNSTSAWTSAGTVRLETTDDLSGYYPVNFQKTQWVQIRGIITTGGTTASSFVPVVEVRLR